MKLYGGKSRNAHPADQNAPAGREKERKDTPNGGHGSLLRRFRVPLIVVGCVVLLALIAVIVYSIWEKPPEVVTEGPTVAVTPKPPVTDPPTAGEKPVETKKPQTTAEPVQSAAPTESPEPTETPEPTPEPYLRKDDCYTFAVLVKDQSGGNTDAILIGRFDVNAGTLDFASIPRDTLVNVSWGAKKASSIYAYERQDMDRVKEHLGRLVGFTVDSYVLMNLSAVATLVDSVGGVYFYVPVNMDYEDPTQNLYIHYAKGEQYLSGSDVIKVLRYRQDNEGLGYGDIGRIETAQKLLKTLASQILTIGNITNLDTFAQIIFDNVKTDLTASNIAFFIRSFLKLSKDNIHFSTAPGNLAMIRSGSYYALDADAWLEIVNTMLNPYNRDLTKEYLDVLQVVGKDEVVSTTGEVIPITSFLDFRTLSY